MARREHLPALLQPGRVLQCHKKVSFQVTLLQVDDLQWVAIAAILSLMASNSGLSLAPSSRPACGMLTTDTNLPAHVKSVPPRLPGYGTSTPAPSKPAAPSTPNP